MHTEIFIEGQQLDITEDISALFTYAVDDIRDFGSRDTNFSKTINLPGSSLNNRLFGHAFEFAAYTPTNPSLANVGSNFNAARAAKCVVLQDGIQIFKGVIRLLEMVYNGAFLEYQCAVFGELGGLMARLGNKLLTDLDFSAYDMPWNVSNIAASWSTAGAGTGVYFPLIDYGAVSTDKLDFQFQALRPALFVKEYTEKIFAAAGYTYDCPLFTTNLFKRLVIPHNEDKVYKAAFLLLNRTITASVSGFLFRSLIGTPALSNTVPFPAGLMDNFSTNTGSTIFTYVPSVAAGGKLSYSVGGLVKGGANKVTARFKVKVGATYVREHDILLTGGNIAAVIPFNFSGTVDITLNGGDTVQLDAVAIETANERFEVELKAGYIKFEANGAQFAPASYGDTLKMTYMIPKNVLQKEFLSSIVKMFNLYIIEDANKSRHLNIYPYPDFYNFGQVLNWTQKLDRSKEIKLKPLSEINARYFNFLYEKDNDYLNELYRNNQGEGYGDRVFDAGATQGLDFVKDKKDVKLIFAGSPLKGNAGLDKYYTLICKISGAIEEPIGSKIRILQAKYITGRTSWKILNGTTTLGTYTVYGYAGHLDDPTTPAADINFGAPKLVFMPFTAAYPAANLFNAYYSAYMAEICDKDSKLLTCYMDLTGVDIYNLDFRKPALIDGVLWRLNKVIDFDTATRGVTKCELLKIIELSY